MINDDEVMLNEMRNTIRSRNSIRNKHLTQLEETRANLNEIKNEASKKLIKTDQDLPSNEQSRHGSAKTTLKSSLVEICLMFNFKI